MAEKKLKKVANAAVQIATPIVVAAVLAKVTTDRVDLKSIVLDAADALLAKARKAGAAR